MGWLSEKPGESDYNQDTESLTEPVFSADNLTRGRENGEEHDDDVQTEEDSDQKATRGGEKEANIAATTLVTLSCEDEINTHHKQMMTLLGEDEDQVGDEANIAATTVGGLSVVI